MKTTFYGPGGYDPDLSDNNIIRIEETPDDAPAPMVGSTICQA